VYHDNYMDIDVKDLHRYPNAERLETEVRIQEVEKFVDRPYYVDNIIE